MSFVFKAAILFSQAFYYKIKQFILLVKYIFKNSKNNSAVFYKI